ncbi:MAG: hypothetical protein CL927_16240 [Deltaproteobacteria bacterium]|nr:hypothetical protein [Deltaproteobacteria bacterium]HCH63131.1 hypothetical protein [Deltaproteobacteria bacterium]
MHQIPRTPLLVVLLATLILGTASATNADQMSPCWGQDLAFFHQIVHSAASGGPWSTPLLLEPRGFFEMVHTHMVLPLIVGLYALLPRQEVLLYAQAGFAALALWPAWRLGEAVAPRGGGILAVLSLALFGPFQGLAMADFRPSALFLPGLMGVWVSAWHRERMGILLWSLLAIAGRQEAIYLLGGTSLALFLLPWGPRHGTGLVRRWWSALHPRSGAVLVGICALATVGFIACKPAMFYHFDPLWRPDPAVLSPDHLADRLQFLSKLGRSGLPLGLLAPTALVPLLPVAREMLETGREWGPVVGPAAHYAAFWMPFAALSAIVGAGRWLGRPGLAALALLNATAVPWPGLRSGPVHLSDVARYIPNDARVAADYHTIHRLSGRAVLWNTAQLRMAANERPRGWVGDWPVPPSAVDYVVAREDDPIFEALKDWSTVAILRAHRIVRRPNTLASTVSPFGVDPASIHKPTR